MIDAETSCELRVASFESEGSTAPGPWHPTPDTRSPAPDPRRICWIELFGPARLAAGVKMVAVEIGRDETVRTMIRKLAARCPALDGAVLDGESETLLTGYIFNRNGRDFLAARDAAVQPGDRLLLLAATAGG